MIRTQFNWLLSNAGTAKWTLASPAMMAIESMEMDAMLGVFWSVVQHAWSAMTHANPTAHRKHVETMDAVGAVAPATRDLIAERTSA